MKQILVILAAVGLVGCGTTSWVSDPSDPTNVKIEKRIRENLKKPTGELTKADLEKVTRLYFTYNELTDIKGLEKLTQLTYLDLTGNFLTDDPWPGLGGSLSVYTSRTLENLTNLKKLGLTKNQLTNVTGLENLTQLTFLILERNQLTDVKALKNLTRLTFLNLGYNKLTELPKGLENLTQLKQLELRGNPNLTKAQIAELQKTLPNCDIRHDFTKSPEFFPPRKSP